MRAALLPNRSEKLGSLTRADPPCDRGDERQGGVGKSSPPPCWRLLAREGYRAGLLDADITGPSILKLSAALAAGGRKHKMPRKPVGDQGDPLNLLLPHEDDPVIGGDR